MARFRSSDERPYPELHRQVGREMRDLAFWLSLFYHDGIKHRRQP